MLWVLLFCGSVARGQGVGEYLKDVRSGNANRMRTAAYRLGMMGEKAKAAAPHLVKALGEPGVRAAARRALAGGSL